MRYVPIRGFALALLMGAAPALAAERGPDACVDRLGDDISACDKALGSETDPARKADLLFRRAYVHNEKFRYEDSLRDLDEAIRLAPDYADAYHERAYTLGELSEFARAVVDSDREVALRPAHAPAYEERAFLRHRAGDLEGANRDRVRAAELKPGDPGAIVARGDAALWLGRFDEAARDAAEGLRLATGDQHQEAAAGAGRLKRWVEAWRRTSDGPSPAARCEQADKKHDYSGANLVGDCTAAMLAASSPAQKADMLTNRSLAWLMGYQDREAATRDLVVAAALNPGNAATHSNLGGAYLQGRHSWAAKRELDRALEIEPGSWMALAQRAAANYNLKDPDSAFADAKKSFEIHPNEVALMVLGDLSNDRGDAKSARLYWMGAYHLGSRDDETLARLKSIGIDHPELEPETK
jgi:Flp pilus assembly protein TadD